VTLPLLVSRRRCQPESEETSPTSQETSREIRLVVDPAKARLLTITPLDGSAGRLGNFCFQYAAALGIAAKNNMTLVLPDNTFVRSMREMFAIKVGAISTR